MSESAMRTYFELLSNEIVAMYGVSKDEANIAIQNSAIQTLIREEPEYVDHVSLSCWAEEVHTEMFA